MLKHLTFFHATLWIAITLLQIKVLLSSKKLCKMLFITMIFLLTQSAIEFGAMFFSEITYSYVYYSLAIVEAFLLSLTSIELSGIILPQMKHLIHRYGPLGVVIPTFVGYILWTSKDSQFILFDKVVRVSQMFCMFSAVLLLFCIAFEDETNDNRYIANGFAFLLVTFAGCAELQMRYGLIHLVRTSWLISWVVGLVWLNLSFRCINNGNSNIDKRFKMYGFGQ